MTEVFILERHLYDRGVYIREVCACMRGVFIFN